MNKGISIIEIIVAMAIFLILAVSSTTVLLSSLLANSQSQNHQQANLLAQQCIEAAKSLKNQAWSFLDQDCSQGCGLTNQNGYWQIVGSQDLLGIFTRKLFILPTFRDPSGYINLSVGQSDPDTKKIICSLDWADKTNPSNHLESFTYLTNWGQASPGPTPTPTPTIQNCHQYCQDTYGLAGSCLKQNQCSGQTYGSIYECSPPNQCCCQ